MESKYSRFILNTIMTKYSFFYPCFKNNLNLNNERQRLCDIRLKKEVIARLADSLIRRSSFVM